MATLKRMKVLSADRKAPAAGSGRCCGACRFWKPVACYAIAIDPEQQAEATEHAEECGMCTVFEEKHREAVAWLQGEEGPFWGKRPTLFDLTHADDGKECGAFEFIDR